MKKLTITSILGLMLLGAVGAHAQTTTIYQDNFQYGSLNGIDGHVASTVDLTGATWTGGQGFIYTNFANTNLTTNQGSDGDREAYLPFTVQANTTYAYTLTLEPTSSNSWQEFGFINNSGGGSSDPRIFDGNNGPTLIYGPGAGGVQIFNGAPGQNAVRDVSQPTGLASLSTPVTFQYLLTSGATTNSFTYSVSANSQVLVSNVAYNGTIDGIQLGGYFENGNISNLSFTSTPVATPEPSTLALFAVGGLGLLILARRRSALSL